MNLLSVLTTLAAVLVLGGAVVGLLYRVPSQLSYTLLLLLYRPLLTHHVETAPTVTLGETLEHQAQWYANILSVHILAT